MKRTWQARAIVAIVICLCAFETAQAGARTQRYFARNGFYAGVMLPQNTVKTNFDGKLVQNGQGEVFLPKVEGKYGFGFVLGRKYDLLDFLGRDYSDVKEGATELSYIRSVHNASAAGTQGESALSLVSLDFKLFFLPKARFQPYVLAGLNYSWLSLKNSRSNDPFENSVAGEDAKFKGLGFNGGLGLAVYLSPQIALNAGWVWRVMYYGDVKNIDRFGNTTVTTEDKLEGSSRTFDLGVRIVF